jgi:hypothetical protein
MEEKMHYRISGHQINGFLKTKIGILGFGGLAHMGCNFGYIVKFYGKIRWRAKKFKKFDSEVIGCEEYDKGLKIELFDNDNVDNFVYYDYEKPKIL